MSAFEGLSAEKQAAVNARIIEGFSSREIYKDGLTQLEYYSKELRAVKDPEERATKFQALLADERDSLAGQADELTFSKTEGLSGGQGVLRKIKETLVTNVDKNAKDYTLEHMGDIVGSLRKQFHYGEEKTALNTEALQAIALSDASEILPPTGPSGGAKRGIA